MPAVLVVGSSIFEQWARASRTPCRVATSSTVRSAGRPRRTGRRTSNAFWPRSTPTSCCSTPGATTSTPRFPTKRSSQISRRRGRRSNVLLLTPGWRTSASSKRRRNSGSGIGSTGSTPRSQTSCSPAICSSRATTSSFPMTAPLERFFVDDGLHLTDNAYAALSPLLPAYSGRMDVLNRMLPNTTHWPQFRGPNASGIGASAKLPTTWSATENVAWKTSLPGKSWSSPIVWGERVFVTSVVRPRRGREAAQGPVLRRRPPGDSDGSARVQGRLPEPEFRQDALGDDRVSRRARHGAPSEEQLRRGGRP